MTHECPGGCGASVAGHLFACRPCWFRLPYGLRMPIVTHYQRNAVAHLRAMAAARRWYQENPR